MGDVLLAAGFAFRRDFVAASIVASGGFFLLGYGAILLMPADSPTAVIWPGNAFVLCLMLRYARNWREYAIILAATFLGDLCSNALGLGALPQTIGYSLVNTLEMTLCLALVGPKRPLRLRGVPAKALFGLKVGVLPTLVAGAAAALVTQLSGVHDAFAAGRNWFLADLLGFCIIFPIGMTISWRQIQKLRLRQRLPAALGTVCLVVGVTTIVYPLHHYPLQFLILPAALVMTSRFRILGAGAAMILIAAVVLSQPAASSPIGSVSRILYLQLFLAVCSLVCVRAAVLLNHRDLQQAVIERRHRRAVRGSRFKSQLLAHVSHEVRSPLSAIIGFSSMLESGSLTPDRAP